MQGRTEEQGIPFGDNHLITNKMDNRQQQQQQLETGSSTTSSIVVDNTKITTNNNTFYTATPTGSNSSTPFVDSPNQHTFMNNDQQQSQFENVMNQSVSSNNSSQQATPIVTTATVQSAVNQGMSPTTHISPITAQSIEQAIAANNANNAAAAAALSMTSSPSLLTMVSEKISNNWKFIAHTDIYFN